MKRLTKIIIGVGLSLTIQACSKSEDAVNRRGHSLLSRVENDTRDVNAGVIGNASANLNALQLLEAKNGELLTPEFLANIQLLSKISEEQIIVIGKDGRSWSYNPGDDAAPELIEAVTTPPSGQLYTLPDGQFWIVSNESIGRRKADAEGAEPGIVRAQSFSTTVLPGDKSKLRVLFAGPTDLILHLDTHVVVLSVQGTNIVNNPFTLATMSPKLDAPIVSAGKASNGAYWFAAGEKLILAEPKGLSYSWTGFHLPTQGHVDYSQLALWLDQTSKAAKGEVMMMQGNKIWSTSGAPIAP